MRPSWLEVENATIFLMSFCVKAQVAVNSVVKAPRQRHREEAVGLCSISGKRRIKRKMPATTIVLEWSRAETGVGPSIAEGSHGCRPNCADFPVAARIRPIRGSVVSIPFVIKKICWISQEFACRASQAMLRISPTSPTRL